MTLWVWKKKHWLAEACNCRAVILVLCFVGFGGFLSLLRDFMWFLLSSQKLLPIWFLMQGCVKIVECVLFQGMASLSWHPLTSTVLLIGANSMILKLVTTIRFLIFSSVIYFSAQPNRSRQMAAHIESGSAVFFSPQSPNCLLIVGTVGFL